MHKKILILGSGNITPVNILCKNLIDHGSYEYSFDGLNLFDNGYTNKNPYLYIDQKFEVPFSYVRKEQIRKFYTLPFRKKMDLIFLILRCIAKLNIKGAFKVFQYQMDDYIWESDQMAIIAKYPIINAHFIYNWNARIIPKIPKHIHVVVSFWGSDLMDTAGPDIYKLQFLALQRANMITTHCTETKEILLSKFGRELKNKVVTVLFGLTDDEFNQLCDNSMKYHQIAKDLFKRHGISIEGFKVVVKIGYNGFKAQNHLAILKEMMSIPMEKLANVLFVIPLTYGASMEYIKDIEDYIEGKFLNVLLLKDYLNVEEAKSISFGCNVMFNLRENDAFNNSMIESIISGAVVVNGSWLPYSLLDENDVYSLKVPKINSLPGTMIDIIDDFDLHHKKSAENKNKIARIIKGQYNVWGWEKALLPENLTEV